jgi:hypothetical protein
MYQLTILRPIGKYLPSSQSQKVRGRLNSFPPTGSDSVLSPHDYALVDLRSSQENLLTGGSVCLSGPPILTGTQM